MSSGAEGHERLCTMDVLHTVLDVTLVLALCLLEIVCPTSVYYIIARYSSALLVEGRSAD